MEFISASAAPFEEDALRIQLSRIFVHGFYDQGLKHIARDKERLADALAHAFQLEGFYVAVEGGAIISIVGVSAGKPPPFSPCKATLRSKLGYVKGGFAHGGLMKFLVNHPMPVALQANEGIIEFVATHPEHRGRGAAARLMEYVMENTPFATYVLEVIDTNAPAIHVYQKLGFGEILRKKMPWPVSRLAGFTHSIYMRRGAAQ